MADLIESNPVANASDSFILGPTYIAKAQGVTGNGQNLYSIKFSLGKYQSPTGSAYAKVYAITGDWGMGETPTGSPLATSNAFDVSTLTTSYTLVEFFFTSSNIIQLVNGTHYAISIEYSGGTETGPYIMGQYCSDLNEGSLSESTDGTNWGGISGLDLCYYLYGTGPSSSPSLSISLSPSLSPSNSPGYSASSSISPSSSESLSESESPSSSASPSASVSPSPSPAFTCDLIQLTDETLNTYGIGSNTTVDAAYAQSFKPTSEYPIGKVQVSVERSGNMTGSLRLLIMTSAAGVPDDIIDTSNNTYSIADLEEGVASHLDFHFDHNVFLDPDNTYFIILDAVDAVVIGLVGNIWIRGSDVFSQASDAYPDGKLMFAYGYNGISDDWSDAAFGGEGILEWMDMYFKICYDPLAWSHSPSLSPSPSISASISPSLTPSSSVSASVSPSLSLSPSPSRSQYEDSYAIKSTVWSDKYKKW